MLKGRIVNNKRKEKRLWREKLTIRKMARIYCKAHHQTKEGLCEECQALLSYALERIDRCPYQEGKPVCSACPIHCYAPAMREKVRQVMRYAGPRMLLRHPILSLQHLLEGRAGKHDDGKT
ncbi:MAG: nitrous oxide-stimulated promoter family protein [Geobacteraceae bacterium]